MGSKRDGRNGGRADGASSDTKSGARFDIWPKFWVVNSGLEDGKWTIHCKVTNDYKKIHAIGGTFPLDKAAIKLDIYCHQIAAINPAAATFFRSVAEAYMASAEFNVSPSLRLTKDETDDPAT